MAVEAYFDEMGRLFQTSPTVAMGLVVIGSFVGFIMALISNSGRPRRRRK